MDTLNTGPMRIVIQAALCLLIEWLLRRYYEALCDGVLLMSEIE